MHTKTKLRRGIGWYGRAFQYGTARNESGCVELRLHGPTDHQTEPTKALNKLPEFKRAAKKAQRRSDRQFAEA